MITSGTKETGAEDDDSDGEEFDDDDEEECVGGDESRLRAAANVRALDDAEGDEDDDTR